ncbi:MAG: BrnT family toxin [Pseudomonadota bacterium]
MARFRLYVSPFHDDDFVWDRNKSLKTFADRDFMFHIARMAFRGRLLRRPDRAHSRNEVRYQVLGEVYGRIVHIVYTPRGRKCRIISVRPATHEEARAYHE